MTCASVFLGAIVPRMMATRVVIGTVLGITLFGATVVAQGTGGRIAGSVADLTGAPLPGALITVHGPSERDVRAGEDGRFGIELLPEGAYTVAATLEGFAPASRAVEIVNGETAVVALILLPRIVEQVTVTADRTGERQVQKIPMAVSVLMEAELRQREAHTVADLAGLAPAVTVAQNTAFSQVTIRGIGSTVVFAGSDPSSAVYIDGVYIARPAAVLTDFIDLDRVEVLRGPQGTLYGHNVVGGALNLTTKVPTDDAVFSARLVLGDFETSRAEVRVSGPVIRSRILASASLVRAASDGYVQDLNHPDNPLGGTDVRAARAVVRVLFSKASELRVRGDYADGDPPPLFYAKVLAVKPGFTADNPSDLHQVRASEPARGRYFHKGASAQFIWRPTPNTVVTSLSAVRRFEFDVRVDTDSTELDLSIGNTHEIHNQLSQEFTLTGERRGITWTGGLFAFKDVDRQPTLSEILFAGLNNTLNPRVEGRNIAAFGQANVPLGSRFAAIAGVRRSRDEKTIDNSGQTMAGNRILTSFQYRDSTSAAAWTPKFAVDYHINERMFAYVSATRGYKSGGFNVTAPEARGGFAPEWAWTYEAGGKWSPLNERARLNGAVYFTDYSDLQVQTPLRPGVVDIRNAASATIRGIEVEAEIQATPQWRLGGHAAWMDARYDRYVAVGPGGTSVDAAGRRLFNAPEYSGRTFLEYQRQLGAGTLSMGLEVLLQSTVYFTALNDPIESQGAYGLVNANITIRPRRHWSIGMFARNLADTDYLTGTSSVPPPAIAGRPGERRRFGVQFSVTF
jgi:iron complex outermembrane receptor protein